jgi:hypothetical protein
MPGEPQEMVQPPRVRWGLLLTFVGVSALVAVALLVVTVFGVLDSAGGPELPRAARDEIARANCQKLTIIEARHTLNADSVEQDMTALRLTRERQAKLHCPDGS